MFLDISYIFFLCIVICGRPAWNIGESATHSGGFNVLTHSLLKWSILIQYRYVLYRDSTRRNTPPQMKCPRWIFTIKCIQGFSEFRYIPPKISQISTSSDLTITAITLWILKVLTTIFTSIGLKHFLSLNWRILAWTASVNHVIYNQFGGWFCPTSGGKNNHKLLINKPDLHNLSVLKFHSIHDHIFLSFLSVFWSVLAVSDNFSSIITKCDTCTNAFSLIAAKLITPTDSP